MQAPYKSYSSRAVVTELLGKMGFTACVVQFYRKSRHRVKYRITPLMNGW